MNTSALFKVGLTIKALNGFAEIIGGAMLLMPLEVARVVLHLSMKEFEKNPNAAIGVGLERLGFSVLSVTVLGALYLMVHGVTKVVLIGAAFKEKMWGYHGLIIILSVFSVLELWRSVEKHSALILALAFFDALIVLLVAKEYSARLRRSVG